MTYYTINEYHRKYIYKVSENLHLHSYFIPFIVDCSCKCYEFSYLFEWNAFIQLFVVDSFTFIFKVFI